MGGHGPGRRAAVGGGGLAAPAPPAGGWARAWGPAGTLLYWLLGLYVRRSDRVVPASRDAVTKAFAARVSPGWTGSPAAVPDTGPLRIRWHGAQGRLAARGRWVSRLETTVVASLRLDDVPGGTRVRAAVRPSTQYWLLLPALVAFLALTALSGALGTGALVRLVVVVAVGRALLALEPPGRLEEVVDDATAGSVPATR